MTGERQRPARAESREVQELRRVASEHPELAAAVEMQLELVEVIRRVQGRIPTPPLQLPLDEANARLRQGTRLLDYGEFPFEWSDFRYVFRQVIDILRRFDTLEPDDHQRLQLLLREGNRLEPIIEAYYRRTARPERFGSRSAEPGDAPALLDQIAALALRPFLARSAEVWSRRVDLAGWQRPFCPICGAEPDLAVLLSSGDRHLVCSRCTGQWPFDQTACPFCDNASPQRITSFASRDRRYRVYGCDVCRKYIKAYDVRGADRPVLPSVDTIATLPLDAAAIQKGYDG